MPYIGQQVPGSYQAVKAVQQFDGDGSTTTFTLTTTVSSKQDVLVSVDGVIQDAASAYTIPDGTTLTFTAAPSTGTDNIFVNYLAPQVGTITPPAENKGNFKAGGLFRTNAQSLTADTTILATENANVTGPFTVASGVTLTVESGGTLVTL
jgi:hypothetical protein